MLSAPSNASHDRIGHFNSCVTVRAHKGTRFLPIALPSVDYVFVGFSVSPYPPGLGPVDPVCSEDRLSAENQPELLRDEGICWTPTLTDGGLKDWPSLPMPCAASFHCSPSGSGGKGAVPKAKLDPRGYRLTSLMWLRGLGPGH